MNVKDYLNIYKFHGGGFNGFKHLINNFFEIHLFDIINNTDTARIRMDLYEGNKFMGYQPVYTTVFKQMINQALVSCKMQNRGKAENNILIFIDLGAGAGKTMILACKSKKFDLCVAVELNECLIERSKKNLLRSKINRNNTPYAHLNENVSNKNWIKNLKSMEKMKEGNQCTLFVFNKNSYDANTVEQSLRILKEINADIIYLYQNPVHHECVINEQFDVIGSDKLPAIAHKNWKYKIYQYRKNF